MKKSFRRIDDMLQEVLRRYGLAHKVTQYRLIELWPEIVGQRIAEVTNAEKIDNDILYVKVKSMTWRTELLYQKHLIVKKIKDKLGSDVISDIRFH